MTDSVRAANSGSREPSPSASALTDPGRVEVKVYLFGVLRRHAALLAQNRISANTTQREVRKALRQTSWRWK